MHRKVFRWWHSRRKKFYRNSRWHLVVDISLVVIIILLIGISLRLFSYNPKILTALNFTHYFHPSPSESSISVNVNAKIKEKTLAYGEEINLTINYNNDGDLALDVLTISPELDSAAFSIEELILVDNNSSSSSNIYIENNSIIVKNVELGQSEDISLLLKWKAIKTDYPRQIDWKLHIDALYEQQKIISDQILPSIKIASDFVLEANIYFHSPQGDQLGIGPLPPIVGIPTTYWLIVKADNSGNELRDLVFSANLPDEVELSDESLLAGKTSYDKARHRLIWQLDSLSASGGDYIANFGLDFTPTAEQVGSNATILSNLRYKVTDTWTNTEISGSLRNLDSSLPADHLNKGLGVVEAE